MEKMKSNSKKQFLASKIEKLTYRLKNLNELDELYKEELDEKAEVKVNNYKFKLSKELVKLERKLSDPEELFAFENAKKIASFDKKINLEYRAKRQSLRRSENIVDKDNNVIGELSEKSVQELEAFKVELDAKKASYIDGLKSKYDLIACPISSEEKAQIKADYESLEKETDAKVQAYADELKVANQAKVEAYEKKVNERVEIASQKLEEVKADFEKVQAEFLASTIALPEDTVLRLENLTMQFGGLKAVNDLSVDVKKGEIFGLIGPNGAGKTTVFNCITQFYKPTSGNVWYKDKKNQVHYLNDYKVHDVIKTGIVRTFQNVEVIGELTILENLLIAAHTSFKTSIFQHMIQSSKLKKEERILRRKAVKILEYLGLSELQDVPPVGMPYGVLKKIELARTLMANANVIILDEPAAGLNDQETIELAETIKKIREEYHVTIFLVEHDMGLVMDICDHICAISFGSKLAYGTPAEIQADPKVQEAYLGSEG